MNTNKAIDFSGAPSIVMPATFLMQTITTALGTVQNSTPTVAQLLGGVVTQTSVTGAGTVTLPTGTLISAGIPGVAVGYTIDVSFTNLGGGQTLTITGATGSTVIGTVNGRNWYRDSSLDS